MTRKKTQNHFGYDKSFLFFPLFHATHNSLYWHYCQFKNIKWYFSGDKKFVFSLLLIFRVYDRAHSLHPIFIFVISAMLLFFFAFFSVHSPFCTSEVKVRFIEIITHKLEGKVRCQTFQQQQKEFYNFIAILFLPYVM